MNKGEIIMYDLEKLEKKFHEFIKPSPDIKYPDLSDIKITEKLLKERETAYIPFGEVTYFLVIEDEKPILYVRVSTRMDTDLICFVDEDGYKCYDVFLGNNRDMRKRYSSHLKNVKRYSDMKDIHF